VAQLLEGWYPDPLDPDRLRFFDGSKWSDDVHPTVSTTEPPQQAGWFPDPLKAGRFRLFNGTNWTDEVRPIGGMERETAGGAPANSGTADSGWSRIRPKPGATQVAPFAGQPHSPTPPAGQSQVRLLSSIPWKGVGLAALVALALVLLAWSLQPRDPARQAGGGGVSSPDDSDCERYGPIQGVPDPGYCEPTPEMRAAFQDCWQAARIVIRVPIFPRTDAYWQAAKENWNLSYPSTYPKNNETLWSCLLAYEAAAEQFDLEMQNMEDALRNEAP
jgi:hypothetical protein